MAETKKKAGAKRGGAKSTVVASKAKSTSGAKAKAKARPAVKPKPVAKSAAKPTVKPKKPAASAVKAKRTSLPPPAPTDAAGLRRQSAKKLAIAIAVAALDKKAERVEIVDIGEKVDYADYLVVMTGRSDRQVVAIASGIEESIKKSGGKTHGREGTQQGHWVLIDFGDVIAHVFLDEARKYYDLEGLWMDAPRVPTPAFVSQNPASSEP